MEKYLFILTIVSTATWGLMELCLLWRDRERRMGTTYRDQGTRSLIIASVLSAFVISAFLAKAAGPYPVLRIPGEPWTAAAGLLLAWIGIAVRYRAVAELGESYRTTVEIDDDQEIVSSGSYKLVRHPSYAGLLMAAAGFGLAGYSWAGLVVCIVLPLSAMLQRIRVEENEMTEVLGDSYQSYRQHTKRLIPGLW
jgi:protein-S-isoprenylcysteine O-methyltransferase Ste14